MSLYLKYRPITLEKFRGNTDVVEYVNNMSTNREVCPHAFLLYGETGCGKTTLARIISVNLGCPIDSADYTEIDSADFRGIDMVREIRKQSSYAPIQGDCRVWVIDECHKMTNDAQNAMLKLLEDTPPHVYLILCTTDVEKMIKTVRGRCSQLQLKPLSNTLMLGLLKRITRAEGETLEEEIYEQIISDALGHPRNAIQILEQVLNVAEDKRLEMAKKTAAQLSVSIDLCRALADTRTQWRTVQNILTGLRDQEPESIRRAVMGYAANALVKNDNNLFGLILEEFSSPFYDTGFPQLVLACYSVIKNR
jgi:DNA polymerase III subunit gamma/tau